MMTLFIGFGKLAKTLAMLLKDKDIHVFSRTKEKVIDDINEFDHLHWAEPESFNYKREVWLLLPLEQINRFFESYHRYFHEDTIFYFCVTKGRVHDYQGWLTKQQKMVPVKFVTEARQLLKDKKGMAAIPKAYSHYQVQLQQWFGNCMDVVIAEEEQVYTVNKAATKKAIELLVELRNDLKKEQIPNSLIDHASQQIILGVIDSYLKGDLGGFGKQVVNEIKKRHK
ncbi:hypothetical protein [Evansella halocellulosilytica]|uniref:hypothetical protein n=1 Tax=Evansella halocellulosilytica TaxID=2011013 RepID=UPI0011553431|nr:hypothetical protein [Evansella halocellulosilytica]